MNLPGQGDVGAKPNTGWRRVALLVLVLAMVGAFLTRAEPDLLEFASEPPVLHPVVTDGSGYLNNGYAQGAHVLSLPGNLVGFSSDGTIAATRSAGGQVKGYRLSDGREVWAVSAEQVVAVGCHFFNPQQTPAVWIPTYNANGVVPCGWVDESAPAVALNLRTGAWLDLSFFREHPTFVYSALDDRYVYGVDIAATTGESRFVSLGYQGQEVSSVTLFDPQGRPMFERSNTVCSPIGGSISCVQDVGQFWIFDARTGALQERFNSPDGASQTADGYWLSPGGTSTGDFYSKAGIKVGATDSTDCLVPSVGVQYSNADYLNLNPDCSSFGTLVGPSGRVFAERTRENRYIVLSQARKRVPFDVWAFATPHISSDESLVAILPMNQFDVTADGVRFFDSHSGELIASFPLPWAWAWPGSGIIYWTSNDWDPDNLLGTQILVPEG